MQYEATMRTTHMQDRTPVFGGTSRGTARSKLRFRWFVAKLLALHHGLIENCQPDLCPFDVIGNYHSTVVMNAIGWEGIFGIFVRYFRYAP